MKQGRIRQLRCTFSELARPPKTDKEFIYFRSSYLYRLHIRNLRDAAADSSSMNSSNLLLESFTLHAAITHLLEAQ